MPESLLFCMPNPNNIRNNLDLLMYGCQNQPNQPPECEPPFGEVQARSSI
jgi:hypothetical protein